MTAYEGALVQGSLYFDDKSEVLLVWHDREGKKGILMPLYPVIPSKNLTNWTISQVNQKMPTLASFPILGLDVFQAN